MSDAVEERSTLKTIAVYVAFVVFTLGFAAATAWPFLTAWQLRYSAAYLASSEWVLASRSVAEVVGETRYTENDTFPKGGASADADGGTARFEHKLVGDKDKGKVVVILERTAGEWKPVRAGWQAEGADYRELEVR
jgi:hypothetical protein